MNCNSFLYIWNGKCCQIVNSERNKYYITFRKDKLYEELNGEAIDVFSLGVIAFVLVTGEFPFENANDKQERRSERKD